MKIQVAVAVERAISAAMLDGAEARVLTPERRTPGPTGISLMRDEVIMSVRDLAVAMLTISDNVATDELINLAGLEAINQLKGGRDPRRHPMHALVARARADSNSPSRCT